jgi:hypothetical protein
MYHAKPKGPTFGKDVEIAKFAVGRYEDGLLPKPITGYTKNFGPGLYEALHKVIQPREGIPASGDIGQATWDVLWPLLDDYHRWQYRMWKVPVIPKPSPVPNLGPLYVGGASVLLHQLTHNTDGSPELNKNYPAYDDGWIMGRTVLAVEDLVVTRPSSADYGDAFYATGKSKLEYWYGHLASAPGVGREFKKGQALGIIGWQPTPHVHLGINTVPLIGHRLLYGANGNGPDYTYGSPTVGAQLREALSL